MNKSCVNEELGYLMLILRNRMLHGFMKGTAIITTIFGWIA